MFVSKTSISLLLVGSIGGAQAWVLPNASPFAHPLRSIGSTNSNNPLQATSDANKDHDLGKEEGEEAATRITSRRSSGTSKREVVGGGAVDRRGTLMTLVGGAVSFAASDMLLGAITSSIGGGGTLVVGGQAVTSSVYGARWNGLFQRIAAMTTKHEAAAAVSPELVRWVARSPAAFANPELRAWVAAQRALGKSRQLMGAAAGLEEGLALVGSVAAAKAVASAKTKTDAHDEDEPGGDSDTADAIATTHLAAQSSESEEFSVTNNAENEVAEEAATEVTLEDDEDCKEDKEE